jgi:hypothetical protein
MLPNGRGAETNRQPGEAVRNMAINPANRFAKELTRIGSPLLALRCSEAIQMAKPKTHFEQVPLEIIKKIIGEEIPPEVIIKPDPATNNKKPKKSLLPVAEQSKASGHTPSQMELTRL